ncbi:hypothetical protein BO82DRAFT_364696 [Aspergillus uvarum CBS 121591]|uniref:Uncharacterized protein n=1 Tax=Aspergillus uvarum CBS 121591 TaxID=1448315 RepID=A0A319D1I5_9EURO|nr:hypothetical protein BO82DRAFT_364696 [Aspergillus uvarum CBS 121591]PYH81798.1 hypothetical protein BO82DRAFT_364696 [Aspergillus uvarum CBS 121591]
MNVLAILDRIHNSWALAPGLDHAPDDLIRLGNIFLNPSEPHRPLTTVTAAELKAQYPEIWRSPSMDIRWDAQVSREFGLVSGVEEVPLETLLHEGLVIWRTNISIDSIVDYELADMPSQSTVQARLTDPAIQALLEQISGSCTLYMVTGTKIVSGFSATGERGHHPSVGPRDALTVAINEPGPKVVGYQMLKIVTIHTSSLVIGTGWPTNYFSGKRRPSVEVDKKVKLPNLLKKKQMNQLQITPSTYVLYILPPSGLLLLNTTQAHPSNLLMMLVENQGFCLHENGNSHEGEESGDCRISNNPPVIGPSPHFTY